MKMVYWLAGAALVATLVVLTLSLGDFLALHDIYNDYVSKDFVEILGLIVGSELPDWTATEGEWTLVQFSFWARVAFLLLNTATLSLCVYFLRRQVREGLHTT